MSTVAVAATQGAPAGLLVVTVSVMVLPASAATGVYLISNGLLDADGVFTVPPPLALLVIVTAVAVPPKVFPLITIVVVPQAKALVVVRVNVGGVTQLQLILNVLPVAVHPLLFFTVML